MNIINLRTDKDLFYRLLKSVVLLMACAGFAFVCEAEMLVGETPGSISVNSLGAAVYSIPIDISAGTAGMEPKLAIIYNSSSSVNGSLGFGCSLEGLSRITRVKATRHQDGFIGKIDFSASDRFALDGQRLMQVNPSVTNYVGAGAEYRTEIDSFRKVVAYGSVGNAPAYFKVWTKSGLIFEYGNSSNSFVEASGRSDALYWAVNKISDTLGNYIEFDYLENAGEHLIASIRYTGNSGVSLEPYNHIEFEYDERPDVRTTYVAGSKQTTTKLLVTIGIHANNEYAWHYSLNYEQGSATGRTRLKSVQRFFGEDYLPKTVFNWTDDVSATVWSNTPTYNPPHTTQLELNWIMRGTAFADVNGDGLPDMLFNKEWNPCGAMLNTGGGWMNAAEFAPEPIAWNQPYYASDYNTGDAGLRLMDLNGDRLVDMVGRSRNTVTASFSNGTGWEDASGFLPSWDIVNSNCEDMGMRFPDLNADGLPDLIAIANTESAKTNNGITWVNAPGFTLPSWLVAAMPQGKVGGLFFPDLNGDSLPDIIGAYEGKFVVAGINNGYTWLNAPQYTPPAYFMTSDGKNLGILFVDLNGDGLVDILNRTYQSTGFIYQNYALLNTGNGWVFSQDYLSPVPLRAVGPSSLGIVRPPVFSTLSDVNGDGLPDIVYGVQGADDSSLNHISTYLNTGNGWSDTPSQKYSIPIPITHNWLDLGTRLLDLNGDGMDDLVYNSTALGVGYRPYGDAGAFLNTTPRPDLLISITPCADVRSEPKIEIEYRTLTESNVYEKGTTAEYPLFNIQDSTYVVSSLALEDGFGGKAYTDYTYKGAVGHYERGFLGFEQFESYDRQKQISVVEELMQEFPFTGQPQFINKYYIPDPFSDPESEDYSQLLSSVTNTYLFDLVSGGTLYAYVAKSMETQWELGMPEFPSSATAVYNWFDSQPLGDVPVTEQPSSLPSFITDGNVTKIKVDYGNGLVESTVNEYYPADTNLWILSRLKKKVSTHSSTDPGITNVVNTVSFDYYLQSGLLAQKTVEPDHATLMLQTDYYRDEYGNVTNETISGSGLATRTVHKTEYDDKGRFIVSQSDAQDHETTYTSHPSLGVTLSVTDPNNQTTIFGYDALGRQLRIDYPDGTWRKLDYEWQTNATPVFSMVDPSAGETLYTRSLFKTVAEASGHPPVTTVFDRLNRTIRTETKNPNGTSVFQNVGYNRLGQPIAVSDKYFSTDQPVYAWSEYDPLGRPKYITALDQTVTEYEYQGLVTSVIMDSNHRTSGSGQPKHQKTTTVKNSLGWVKAVTNAAGKAVTYGYDTAGHLLETRDPENNVFGIRYDIRGNRIYQDDPDMGEWNYVYDTVGQLKSKTDANGNRIEFGYDELGRMLARTNWLMGATLQVESISSWEYDGTDDGCWIGALRREQQKDGLGNILDRTSYAYDSFGRPMVELRNLDNKWYYNTYRYDQFSRLEFVDRFWRPKEIAGPGNEMSPVWNRFTTQNHYNGRGALLQVDDSSGHVWWEADEDDFDAKGRLLQYRYGNNIVTANRFNAQTGLLEEVQCGNGSASLRDIQWGEFEHDRLGNLAWRKDSKRGLREDFTYDEINRVETTTIQGNSTLSMVYSDIGNIKNKQGSSTYDYSKINAGPHAVTSIGNNSYIYDNNGNIVRRDVNGTPEFSVNWTSFNKPRTIFDGLNGSEFTYDSDRIRLTQLVFEDGVVAKKKIYIESSSIEQDEVLLNPTETDRSLWQWTNTVTRFFISTPSGAIGVYEDAGGSVSRKYLHKDNLGSVVAISGAFDSQSGTAPLLASYSFDAWGAHRNASDWSAITNSGNSLTASSADRGFTGHEMLDHLNLVHMNGRIYDQTIGRFISADPYIQAPGNLQSYNRYSYVWNNPLSSTDPSGYFTLPSFNIGNQLSAIKEYGLSRFNFTSHNYQSFDSAMFGAEINTPFGSFKMGMETRLTDNNRISLNNGGWAPLGNDSGMEGRFGFSFSRNETGVRTDGSNIARSAPSAIASATMGSTALENPKFSNGGGYWNDVGAVFVGYGDAATGFGKGIWQLVRHPVQSARGMGYAATHPVQTWNTISADYSTRWNSGPRGKGSVVGEGLIAVLTMGAGYADDAGNLGRIGNAASKVDAALPDELAPKTTTALAKYEPWPKTPTSPHADGFLFGARQAETAQPGQIFSRLGNTSGSYVAPPGTSLSARGLPAGYQGAESLWRVTSPFSMESGLSAPWQGSSGMGIQHKLPQSIDSLWRSGYLSPVQ